MRGEKSVCSQGWVVWSVHRDAGAGLYRVRAWVTTSRIREGSLIGLLCSQRAHDQNVLPRCAQWETNSGYPPGGGMSELGGSIESGAPGPQGNGMPPRRPAPFRARHRDRFALVRGETVCTRLGCLRSRGRRGCVTIYTRGHQQGMCRDRRGGARGVNAK